jgi:hypothetical protein
MIGIAALTVFQVTLSGVDTFVTYFRDVLPALATEGQPSLNHSNSSVLGFAQRLFSQNQNVIPLVESPALLALTRYGLSALLFGVMVYLISRPIALAKTPLEKFDLEYALVMIVALLLGSTLALHGIASLLLAYFVLLKNAQRRQRRFYVMAIFLSAALISMHLIIILGYLQPPSSRELPALALSMPFFGILLAWGLLVRMLVMQQRAFALSSSAVMREDGHAS